MLEALVSTVIQQLSSLTNKWGLKQVTLIWNVEEDMKKLDSNLKAVKAVLKDAEKKQFDTNGVRDWLDKLKDVCEDMEDVFDEWNTNNAREVASNPFSIKKLSLNHEVANKIKKFSQDLATIFQERQNFPFLTRGAPEQPKLTSNKTTSFVDVSQVFGRDKETKLIISKLFSDAGEKIGIIPIVGAGGMGKTTLAQLVYNDDSIKTHFQKQIWVCVSDPFDSTVVARAIIEALGSDPKRFNELQSLYVEIGELIKDEKVLLILDDVWHDVGDGKWEQLMQLLRYGGVGSKIVVTTRKMTVASMMRANNNVIDLHVLSDDLCWMIFKNQAFSGRGDVECQQLEKIGKEIVKKCKGVPLVAKILGGVMYDKKGRLEWMNVLHNELWDVKTVEAQVFSPYLLSYYDLPSLERDCFAFCSIFPKDYKIERKTVVEMWMSQGYFCMEKNPEKEGEDCFKNLAMRSFFQDFKKDEDGIITSCKMHDIVHDFAQYLTKKETLLILDGKDITNLPNHNRGKIRNITITPIDESINVYYEKIPQHRLRNLFIKPSLYSERKDTLMLSNFTSLRSLTFCDGNLQVMHKDIDKLIHLRYLDLLGTRCPKELLSSIYNLWNLETLKISDLDWRTSIGLPPGIEKLVNLRHLYVSNFSILPKGITELRNLQTVDIIKVRGHDDEGGSILTSNDLKKLHGVNVTILLIERWNEIDQNPLLMNWEGLQHLIIQRKGQSYLEVEQGDRLILDTLQPHPNLKYLSMYEYMASTLYPSWTMTLTNLRVINLRYWPYCSEILMPLGKLPMLEEVCIVSMDRLENMGSEFWGISGVEIEESDHNIVLFPKLERLEFHEMGAWKEWGIADEDSEPSKIIAPVLRSLRFYDCQAIEAIPEFLLNKGLQELTISYSCERLLKRYERETGPDWAKISHIPKVYFRGRYD